MTGPRASFPGIGDRVGAPVWFLRLAATDVVGNQQDARAYRPPSRRGWESCSAASRSARRRLADACERWAFCSLTSSPGARRYYDLLRARGKTHSQATRQLANRWVGILHTLLERREAYQEEVAWPEREEALRLVT